MFRAGIEFRGLDIQSIRGEPWVRLFSVNAIGDLFSSTLNLEDTEVRNIRILQIDIYQSLLDSHNPDRLVSISTVGTVNLMINT